MLQVDRIEADIQRINPGIKYVDLETDRNRFDSYKTPAMKSAKDAFKMPSKVPFNS